MAQLTTNGYASNGGLANGHASKDKKIDKTRWRLLDERGVQTWHYLESDEQVEKWPQSTADKYFLGLDTEQPDLPPAHRPLEAAENALTFFSKLQLPPGNWACEYGGPMFLLPGLVITWYVTETPIPEPYKIEIANYLYARQHPVDGGWGLHIEGDSSVFGTVLNYVAMRLIGVSAEDPRMIKARGLLHKLGGATHGPHWAKFWLSVLGVTPWELVNPVPPEVWLLPDWVPIAPWRWWIHMRQVMCPMSLIWSKRWSYEGDALTESLKDELFAQPYSSINFASHRSTIASTDNYHPKSWVLNALFFLIVWIWMPLLRTNSLKKRAEEWAWWLIVAEDKNTDYANLGPVNSVMNMLACYIEKGPDSFEFRAHRKTAEEFIWVKDEGMLMNGTNGVQNWDVCFFVRAVIDCGFHGDPKWKPMLTRALEFLEDQQIREECHDMQKCYRHNRKGAWGFSNRKQGYTVSDTTSEGLKAVLLLQDTPGYPTLISSDRLEDTIDVLLTMQNPSGGCASYEPQRGSELLEYLNGAEVFGRIMVEYDYPECTTAVTTALTMFQKYDPKYRSDEIRAFKERAMKYIRKAQREDGSWYGSWGICFTYATMFGMESLSCAGENHGNSERVRRACKFLLDHQMEDGGWGETYRSCETGVYHQHPQSQVVQTAWAVIALLEAEYPDPEPMRRALRLVMGRQKGNGEWAQEAIEGVFNKSCMISYPNYKFIFPIKALGMFAKRWGNEVLA